MIYTEIPVPIEAWRAIDKKGWHDLIKQWNRTKGFSRQIPSATVRVSTAFLPPQDRKRADQDRKRERRKDLMQAPVLTWTEVPQRLPYRKEGDVVYVEKTFTELVKKQTR